MVEVVYDPRRQELAERHLAKIRMPPSSDQVVIAHERVQLDEVGAASHREAVQKLGQAQAIEPRKAGFAVDRAKDRRPVVEDHAGPIDPVDLLDVDEMPNNLVRRPCTRSLVTQDPIFREVPEQ